jgi:hypothetical protein
MMDKPITIAELDDRIVKGCGIDFSNSNQPICICGGEDDIYTLQFGKYCSNCFAKHETLEEWKADVIARDEKFKEFIGKLKDEI